VGEEANKTPGWEVEYYLSISRRPNPTRKKGREKLFVL